MPTRAVPAAGDQHQNANEQLSGHRDLGHMERDVAPVADTFAPILISFSFSLV